MESSDKPVSSLTVSRTAPFVMFSTQEKPRMYRIGENKLMNNEKVLSSKTNIGGHGSIIGENGSRTEIISRIS